MRVGKFDSQQRFKVWHIVTFQDYLSSLYPFVAKLPAFGFRSLCGTNVADRDVDCCRLCWKMNHSRRSSIWCSLIISTGCSARSPRLRLHSVCSRPSPLFRYLSGWYTGKFSQSVSMRRSMFGMFEANILMVWSYKSRNMQRPAIYFRKTTFVWLGPASRCPMLMN